VRLYNRARQSPALLPGTNLQGRSCQLCAVHGWCVLCAGDLQRGVSTCGPGGGHGAGD
jgi:hypothetical protein